MLNSKLHLYFFPDVFAASVASYDFPSLFYIILFYFICGLISVKYPYALCLSEILYYQVIFFCLKNIKEKQFIDRYNFYCHLN